MQKQVTHEDIADWFNTGKCTLKEAASWIRRISIKLPIDDTSFYQPRPHIKGDMGVNRDDER